jgi:hypothetical protein
MDLIKDYNEDTIMDMIKVYNKHLQQKEYRRNYYSNKYQNNEEYRLKKKETNKIYMRNKRANDKQNLDKVDNFKK